MSSSGGAPAAPPVNLRSPSPRCTISMSSTPNPTLNRASTPRLPVRPLGASAVFAIALASLPASLAAQGVSEVRQTGPVIESAGPSFAVENPTFTMPGDHEYRVVWEMVDGPDEPTDVDPGYATLARFLNLHARHGVDPARIHLAAVVHGSGWHALLSDEAYAERFGGIDNPSRPLILELLANGVEIVLCGQTAGARGVDRSELLPGVDVGLSAMTALHWFQSEGYTLNPW